jgi:RNA polymerase sigma factor (sigma-70 family)
MAAIMGGTSDESELVERSRQGDREAFNAIVAAYQDLVYNVCLRMLGSPQSAEDVTQEAFFSAFRNLGRMRGPTVRAWLLRIAANACIDEIRRRRRQPQLSLDMSAQGGESGRPLEVPDPAAGPEQLALRFELREALRSELLLLPEDQRLAVVLCDVEGLSYEEIAAAMGSSLGTVKSRISRGRARLREALRARGELFGDLVRPSSSKPKGE